MSIRYNTATRDAMALLAIAAFAQPGAASARERMEMPRMEAQRAPRGYDPIMPPRGIDVRPHDLDRAALNHNFRASRQFHIGAYAAPANWRYRRWSYGDILPGPFWAPQYRLADFWLFGLDVPPAGYEWVRYGNDALLIDMATGEVVQAVYDDFL